MIEDISLKLLTGKPIDINIAKVYPLKINDIVELGEDKYNSYLNLLLFDVDLLEIDQNALEEAQVDKFTTYHFLLLGSIRDKHFKDKVIEAFECFLKEKIIFNADGFFYIKHKNNSVNPITHYDYMLFRKVLIKQNYLKELEEEEDLIFGNELARQWYLDLKKKELSRPKPKSDVDLHSIISSVMWKTHKSVDEILEMTIYQLYDGYFRLSLINDCNNLAQGIYHGAIDRKEIKDSDLNWAKIIKFNK